MTILHINTMKTWRGGERQLALLIEELNNNDIKQILLCRKDSALEKYAHRNNIIYISFKRTWFSKFIQANRVARLVKSKNISAIHCHESKALMIAVIAKIGFACKAPLILHRRVVFPIKGFFSKKLKYANKYIDKVICISKAVETTFIKTTNNTNTVVIPSMIDTNRHYKNTNMLSSTYHITNKKIVGYVAALTQEKDHKTFLKTAKILSNSNSNIHFVIAGEGKLKNELIQYAQNLGVAKNVTFLGFVENIYDLIPEIDILLFTSQKEGLGSTILDFFLAKKPVVCVKNGGSEEIVINDKTGYICEIEHAACLAKHVNILLENPTITSRITNEAYAFLIHNFSTQKITQEIIKVYRKTIGPLE